MRRLIYLGERSRWRPPRLFWLASVDHVLCEFPDVSKTDLGSCSLVPFKISTPPDSAPVFSRPYRINPILAKQADAVLEPIPGSRSHPALGLSVRQPHGRHPQERRQHSNITVNYQKLNAINSLSQLPVPHVDEVLDPLGKGRTFSLFDLVSSFRQITIGKDTIIPLTAFCTHTHLTLRVARRAPR